MVYDGYLTKLGELRHRAMVSTEVNDCLEIYDRVEDILDSPKFEALDPTDKKILYRAARDVYKPIISSLAQFVKESKGFERWARSLLTHL